MAHLNQKPSTPPCCRMIAVLHDSFPPKAGRYKKPSLIKERIKNEQLAKAQSKLQYFNYLSVVNGKMNKKSNQQSLTE